MGSHLFLNSRGSTAKLIEDFFGHRTSGLGKQHGQSSGKMGFTCTVSGDSKGERPFLRTSTALDDLTQESSGIDKAVIVSDSDVLLRDTVIIGAVKDIRRPYRSRFIPLFDKPRNVHSSVEKKVSSVFYEL